MREMIEALWNGKFSPKDRQFKQDTAYPEALQAQLNHEEILLALLGEGGKEVLEQYQQYGLKVAGYDETEAFVVGFRLGARLIMEAICNHDGFFEDG